MGERTEEEGETAVEELELALKWTKTKKTADRDSLNVDIFKCRSTDKLLIAWCVQIASSSIQILQKHNGITHEANGYLLHTRTACLKCLLSTSISVNDTSSEKKWHS